MNGKPSFIKFIQVWGVVILIAMGATIVTIDITNVYMDFKSRSEQVRNDYVVQQRQVIKREVDRVVTMIHHKKAQSEELTKIKIRSRVYEGYTIAQNIYQQNKDFKSEVEIKQMIIDVLRPIRFAHGKAYYFIGTLSADIVLAGAFPEYEGENVLDLQDSRGRYVAREEMNLLHAQGEGFAIGYWPKPNKDQSVDYKKITFVKKLDIYDWSIGAGLYVDDVDEQIKADILSTIGATHFGRDGYIFVVRYDGTLLMNNTDRQHIGENSWDLTDNNGVKIVQELRNAVESQDGDFIYYVWNKPSSNLVAPKVSFARGIEDWEWMIGAGVYLDDIDTKIAVMHTAMNRNIKIKIFYFVLIVAGIVAFFLFLFRLLRQRLINDFDLFLALSNQASTSSEKIDRNLIQFDELDRMAENTNELLQNLRQSEEKFRRITENAVDVIFRMSLPRGKYEYLSPSCFELFGYKPEEVYASPLLLRRLIHPESEEYFKAEWEKTSKGQMSPTHEYKIYDKAGNTKWIHQRNVIVNDENGKQIAFEGIVTDITKRKIVEQDLQKIEKLESIGTLAGGIAHDFNNILMGLFGNVAMAKKKLPEDHPAMKYLDGAENSMARATSLTKQLLTFAKGGAPLKENVSIGLLAEEVVRFDLSGSNVKLIFNQAKDLWLAEVDKGQIQQVISNLTINANQAMPDGGHLYITLENAHVSPELLPDLKAGKYVKIQVRDEGSGIEREHLARIFDPYFTTKQTGNGLGLATVYSIIHKHSGSLSVESTIGTGTSFTIYLPASEVSDLVVSEPVTAKELSVTKPARILIMDDEEVICQISSQLLGAIGFSAETATDGNRAIEVYKQALLAGKPFDVVIMDLTIPGGMNGEETIKRLLAIDPEAKAIVSSGYAEDQVVANYAEFGFKGIVAKPYTKEQLQVAIQQVLNG